jgi:hypothetical protein
VGGGGGGAGRPAGQPGVGDNFYRAIDSPPTPDPSPPLASLAGEGSKS